MIVRFSLILLSVCAGLAVAAWAIPSQDSASSQCPAPHASAERGPGSIWALGG
jgi:hypothetical protein